MSMRWPRVKRSSCPVGGDVIATNWSQGGLIVAGSLLFLTIAVACASAEAPETRWDERMLKAYPQWVLFVEDRSVAARPRLWGETKAALTDLVRQYPEGEFVDEAHLALAEGAAYCSANPDQARDILELLDKEHPDATCCYDPWPIGPQYGAYRGIGEIWRMAARQLVRERRDGRVVRVEKLGRGRKGLTAAERAFLALFAHLDRFPVRTRDVSFLCRVQLHVSGGHHEQAIEQLQNFIAANRDQALAEHLADRKAAGADDDVFLVGLERPFFFANAFLLDELRALNRQDEAIAVAEAFCRDFSHDGWYWRINETLGDLYMETRLETPSQVAQNQYRLALKGLLTEVKNIGELDDNRFGILPSSGKEVQLKELKEKIRRCGGKIDVGSPVSERTEQAPPERDPSAPRETTDKMGLSSLAACGKSIGI